MSTDRTAGGSPRAGHDFYQAVYQAVRHIPRGKVATYGQLAALLGSPRAARAVGYALFNLPDHLVEEVPWQRVINASGGISAKGDVIRAELQRRLLEQEGVVFEGDVVNLKHYRWEGLPLLFLTGGLEGRPGLGENE